MVSASGPQHGDAGVDVQAARMITHAGRWFLGFCGSDSGHAVYERHYAYSALRSGTAPETSYTVVGGKLGRNQLQLGQSSLQAAQNHVKWSASSVCREDAAPERAISQQIPIISRNLKLKIMSSHLKSRIQVHFEGVAE